MRIDAKDNINTRKCYLVTGVNIEYPLKKDPNKKVNIVNVKEIEFMDLNEDDIFILHEEDGTVVTWNDGKDMVSKATGKPYYKTVNGLRIKSVNTDTYKLPFTDFKIVEGEAK